MMLRIQYNTSQLMSDVDLKAFVECDKVDNESNHSIFFKDGKEIYSCPKYLIKQILIAK